MTLPPRPTYSCLGKEAFPEKRHADAAASRVATRARGAVHAYRCTFCHAWHVGSAVTPKAKRSSISKRGRR